MKCAVCNWDIIGSSTTMGSKVLCPDCAMAAISISDFFKEEKPKPPEPKNPRQYTFTVYIEAPEDPELCHCERCKPHIVDWLELVVREVVQNHLDKDERFFPGAFGVKTERF